MFAQSDTSASTSKVTVNKNKQPAVIKCFYHDIILNKKKIEPKLSLYFGFSKDFYGLEQRLTLH